MLRPLVVTLTLAAALAYPAVAAAACADAELAPTKANSARVRAATLCLLNEERASRELPPLRAQSTLRQVATKYARAMVREQFFDHVSPDGSTMLSRIRETSYLDRMVAWSIGENLAWGSGQLATPAATVRAWMRSTGHRANILDTRFRDVGIGVALGAPEELRDNERGATYVAEFGRRVKK